MHFPLKNGDIPASYVSLPENIQRQKKGQRRRICWDLGDFEGIQNLEIWCTETFIKEVVKCIRIFRGHCFSNTDNITCNTCNGVSFCRTMTGFMYFQHYQVHTACWCRCRQVQEIKDHSWIQIHLLGARPSHLVCFESGETETVGSTWWFGSRHDWLRKKFFNVTSRHSGPHHWPAREWGLVAPAI